MTDVDYRAIVAVGLFLLLVYFVNMRADVKRQERRFKLQSAARSFADSIVDFSEGS